MTYPSNWTIFENDQAVAKACAQIIIEQANQAIQQRGAFHLVTAGGTTPLNVYKLLAQCPASQTDWQKWHIYLGDERCLPAEDAERNSTALHQAWLKLGTIPTQNIHFMPTELGMVQAAQAYQKMVEAIEWFDLTLLGMGEDGHTASLFPGHSYPENLSVITESNSPKPPKQRVSLSFSRLAQSRWVIKLITGASKAPAVKQWLAGQCLPIQQVEGLHTQVWLDKAATSLV